MKNVFQSLKDRRERSVVPVNIGRKLKHAVFIGILVISAIFVTLSKLPEAEEPITDEQAIESYDFVTEIEIVFDEETISETVTDMEDPTEQE